MKKRESNAGLHAGMVGGSSTIGLIKMQVIWQRESNAEEMTMGVAGSPVAPDKKSGKQKGSVHFSMNRAFLS